MTTVESPPGIRPAAMVVDEPPTSSEDEAISDIGEPGKDATEAELERLVFGDAAGFKEGLKSFKQVNRLNDDAELSDGEEDQNALTTVDSADLFFLDSGPGDAQSSRALQPDDSDDDDRAQKRESAAWEDSDDGRLEISLMAVPRLRKLRKFEGEDVISGMEYTRRLRKQFELLSPRPDWANWSPTQPAHKRRRRETNNEGSSEGEMSSGNDESDMEDDDITTQPLAKLLRSSDSLTRSKQSVSNKRIKLRSEAISIERMKDISPVQPSAITSLSIHPTLPLLLSSGLSSTLFLHHLQPHPTPPDQANPLITSLHLKHTPLTTTAFAATPPTHDEQYPTGTEPRIYLSSRRRYFHLWDLPTGEIRKITRVYGHQDSQRSMEVLKPSPCGRYIALQGTSRKDGGVVNILDATTSQWIAQIRIESRKGLADFAWWSDGEGICLVGRGGEVSEWSTSERKFVARWQDEGAVGTTTLELGGAITGAKQQQQQQKSLHQSASRRSFLVGPDRWIAIGSTSGIVNIYERTAWAQGVPANPTPTKVLDNLTTPISHLAFSPCGQLLAMGSRWKRDALRLVHLPSCSVYRNWPTSKTPLGRISALCLGQYETGSDAGKVLVLVVGNEAGVLRGWEITG